MNKIGIIGIIAVITIALSGCMGGGGGSGSASGDVFSAETLASADGGSSESALFLSEETDDGSNEIAKTTHNPEPATLVLFGSGLLGMAALKRKKKS